ncbi:hypothetical protein BpHYR1_024930 [Brachionus plicatilis]|uniref:Tc1-like transposase DDE domain-containing protein n=1 Tax=Brachionus plicatilis TaxID=10195 RepID=A0A3M7SHH4_BRAPC|nr:hypothetical protein BpHYR1_024930 [Brachionus plicatilis]
MRKRFPNFEFQTATKKLTLTLFRFLAENPSQFLLFEHNIFTYTSLLCTTFLNFNNIVWVIKVKAPAYSTDLNPIEMVWHESIRLTR